jgi:hypothetical protein
VRQPSVARTVLSNPVTVVTGGRHQGSHQLLRAVQCGKGSDKMMRTPISHEVALVREKELQRGNTNRTTLAVPRKLMAYMLAVER